MAFDLDMISIGCVAPMDPVMKFSTRVSFHFVGMQRGTHRELMLVTSNHEHLEVMEKSKEKEVFDELLDMIFNCFRAHGARV